MAQRFFIQTHGRKYVAVPLDSDVWACTAGFEAHGLCGMKRNAWKDVPGYAERVCNYLVGIMTGCRVPLNF